MARILHVTSFRSRLVLLASGSCRPPVITVLLVENDESSRRRRCYLDALGDKTAIADLAWRRCVDTRRVIGTVSDRKMIDALESHQVFNIVTPIGTNRRFSSLCVLQRSFPLFEISR